MYVLQNLHWFAILIGGLVFFHELGHFLVAKACGVKVLRFSLGFGPRLLGFTRGDTEYRISALPLGGYVKMLGEMPGSEVPPEEGHRAFSSKPVWQRASIAVAGPAFNFLLAFLVYVFMFAGTHTFGDTKLGVVTPGDPAWNAGLRPGDRIVSVHGEPVEEWEELREVIGSRPGDQVHLTYERDGERHRVTIEPAARTESNIFEEQETRGRIGVSLQYLEPVIAVVDPDSPAAQAGLVTDDVVEKVGDKPVEAWHELRAALAQVPKGSPVVLTVRRGAGPEEVSAGDASGKAARLQDGIVKVVEIQPDLQAPEGLEDDIFSDADPPWGYTGLVNKDTVVQEVEEETPAADAGIRVGDRLLHLKIRRPDNAVAERPIGVWGVDLAAFSGVDARSEFTVTLQRGREVLTRTFELEERQETDELKNVRTRYVFGAKNDSAVIGTYVFERSIGPVEALVQAGSQVGQDTTLIGKGIAMLVQGRLPLDTMGGPIMLFVIAEKSAKRGWEHFLRIMAVISVNLGLLNLLPIPVLDGGHLMFFGIEAIRRRPPSLRTREIAHLVGLALLLMLMVLVFKNDILRYVLG